MISDAGMGMRIYTNGTYIDEDSISRFKKLNLDEVQISVDGANKNA